MVLKSPGINVYAVIFTAEIRELDDKYSQTAAMLRQRAMDDYGCRAFTAVTEGSHEIAISHWDSLEAIQVWKQDLTHLDAQSRGREHWYKSYRVEVVEVLREYGAPR